MTPPRTRDSRSRTKSPSASGLFPTKNDLPEETRIQAVALLNARLADALDLQSQTKQAHWNVKGPHFVAFHKLFDEVYAAASEYVDLIAERIMQLGGTAEGTVRQAAGASKLPEYPSDIYTGNEHIGALSAALGAFGHNVREGLDELEAMHDPISVDILTEIGRGIDQWLWFVEAHQQIPTSAEREEVTQGD